MNMQEMNPNARVVDTKTALQKGPSEHREDRNSNFRKLLMGMAASDPLREALKADRQMILAELKVVSHLLEIDHLTEVLSRIGYAKRLRSLVEKVGNIKDGDQLHYASIAFDLDKFKNINDKFGHESGDQVLKEFAKILSSVLKELASESLIVRPGGDEFGAVVAIHGHDTEVVRAGIETVNKKIREEVESRIFYKKQTESGEVVVIADKRNQADIASIGEDVETWDFGVSFKEDIIQAHPGASSEDMINALKASFTRADNEIKEEKDQKKKEAREQEVNEKDLEIARLKYENQKLRLQLDEQKRPQ